MLLQICFCVFEALCGHLVGLEKGYRAMLQLCGHFPCFTTVQEIQGGAPYCRHSVQGFRLCSRPKLHGLATDPFNFVISSHNLTTRTSFFAISGCSYTAVNCMYSHGSLACNWLRCACQRMGQFTASAPTNQRPSGSGTLCTASQWWHTVHVQCRPPHSLRNVLSRVSKRDPRSHMKP